MQYKLTVKPRLTTTILIRRQFLTMPSVVALTVPLYDIYASSALYSSNFKKCDHSCTHFAANLDGWQVSVWRGPPPVKRLRQFFVLLREISFTINWKHEQWLIVIAVECKSTLISLNINGFLRTKLLLQMASISLNFSIFKYSKPFIK